MDETAIRPIGVVYHPASRAADAYRSRVRDSAAALANAARPATSTGKATGRPDLDLHRYGGHTITDLVFVNCYLGGDRWDGADITAIDGAIAETMSDAELNNVMEQYFPGSISSRMLPSRRLTDPIGARFFKDQAEAIAANLFRAGALENHAPTSSVICLLLPSGAVLVDGFSPNHKPKASEREEHEHRSRAVLKIDDDAVNSLHGLGGYHGSVHVDHAGQNTPVYYAVGVYSEGNNGIPAFDSPWKNVVATFYHELNEARTDADVEDVNRAGGTPASAKLLGWYSPSRDGGECGDIPMNTEPLQDIMKEVELAGGGRAPVQFQWSNAVHGPQGPVSTPQPKA